ncbi:hypothetical protein [Pseudoxanthomonas putridarboris]|uniref:Transmembrane protein n=1 Tax=Pseudoxanthomonas putridarboris TaxID=752605 RepID=A0ABU9IXN4_9GAMM
MAPRAEFVLVSALLAALLLVVAFVTVVSGWQRLPQGDGLGNALKFAPVSALAAGLAAWLASAWHRRAQRAGRRWKAGGLALRTLLIAFLLFPLLLAGWVLAATAADQWMTAQPEPWRDALAWLPVIVFYGSAFAVVYGAVPAFLLEYFACRRYLRRQAGTTTGQP